MARSPRWTPSAGTLRPLAAPSMSSPASATGRSRSPEHDFDALRAASTRVVGVGAQSGQQIAGRVALAERLGMTPVTLPDGHDGFLGGEYGSTACRTRSPRSCTRPHRPTDG